MIDIDKLIEYKTKLLSSNPTLKKLQEKIDNATDYTEEELVQKLQAFLNTHPHLQETQNELDIQLSNLEHSEGLLFCIIKANEICKPLRDKANELRHTIKNIEDKFNGI